GRVHGSRAVRPGAGQDHPGARAAVSGGPARSQAAPDNPSTGTACADLMGSNADCRPVDHLALASTKVKQEIDQVLDRCCFHNTGSTESNTIVRVLSALAGKTSATIYGPAHSLPHAVDGYCMNQP